MNEGGPYVQYDGEATFARRCKKCNRIVRADKSIQVSEERGLAPDFNATCKKCGRTHMVFLGFV
jgi:RNase P subunit RPR2